MTPNAKRADALPAGSSENYLYPSSNGIGCGRRTHCARQSFARTLAEYGVVVGMGIDRLRRALPEILEDRAYAIPGLAKAVFADAEQHLRQLDACIATAEAELAIARLETICKMRHRA